MDATNSSESTEPFMSVSKRQTRPLPGPSFRRRRSSSSPSGRSRRTAPRLGPSCPPDVEPSPRGSRDFFGQVEKRPHGFVKKPSRCPPHAGKRCRRPWSRCARLRRLRELIDARRRRSVRRTGILIRYGVPVLVASCTYIVKNRSYLVPYSCTIGGVCGSSSTPTGTGRSSYMYN